MSDTPTDDLDARIPVKALDDDLPEGFDPDDLDADEDRNPEEG
jgi:hypothetical protein